MDKVNEFRMLTQGMDLEQDLEAGGAACRPVVNGRSLGEIPITEAQMPNGKRIKLLKSMLTSACERNCYYCPFRAGRDMRRATFKPEEMAKTFMAYHQAGAVEGIFLSSGVVGGGVRTQDLLLDTADILRNKYQYRGYLHLKVMPGSERDQVHRAMQLVSRISVNLEAPNTRRLQLLAPRKQFTEELLQPLKWAEEIRRTESPHTTWNGRWASSTTQFVVGAVGESDLELLAASEFLYRHAGLQRAYYSRFNPIVDTPLENHPAEKPLRMNRLYQSSFLLRDYGFTLEEMPFSPEGNLPLTTDPKLAWAQQSLAHQPVELNLADRSQLLRIPGIGLKSAALILRMRRRNKIRDLQDLRKMGIRPDRAAPFILLDGRRPEHQISLFA
jgi:predicted DNA-binding helix-hairpin-helix protein